MAFFFHSVLPFTETSLPINKGIFFPLIAHLVWGFGNMASGLDSMKWSLDCLFYHIHCRTRCCTPVWVVFQGIACRWGKQFRALQRGRHPAIFSFLLTLNLWATSRARLSLICCYCVIQQACGLIIHVWICASKCRVMSVNSWSYCDYSAELPPALQFYSRNLGSS